MDSLSTTVNGITVVAAAAIPAETCNNNDIAQSNDTKTATASGNTVLRPPVHVILEEHGYSIIGRIGSGSFALVNKAVSAKERQIVAIKIVSKSKAPSDYLRKFLPREVDVVKGLSHPNIIKYYRCIETTRRVYIVMQYASNGSLLELIRRRSQLPEIELRCIYRQLVSAIGYCHSKGIVHRDIKCENLLFDANNVLKIIDFGFARRYERRLSRNLSETYCGSYAYACPEILRGEPYDPRHADVWASGVVLYAMAFGRLPFDDTSFAKLVQQVNERLNFSTTKLKPVGDALKACIQRILSPTKKVTLRNIQEDQWFLMHDEKDDELLAL